jgi:hypothetical protein
VPTGNPADLDLDCLYIRLVGTLGEQYYDEIQNVEPRFLIDDKILHFNEKAVNLLVLLGGGRVVVEHSSN